MNKFNKLLANNKFLLALSFVIALIIWLFISITYSPQVDRVISDVPVEISLSSVDGAVPMSVFGNENTTVKVAVRGKKYMVERLDANSLTVSANTESVTKAGEYNLSLSAKKNSSNSDYEIVSVEPSSVSVYLDAKSETTFELAIDCVGASVENLQTENTAMLLEPEFTDESDKVIDLVGPETEIKKIASVRAVANVNKVLTETETYDAGIFMYDKDGNVLYNPYSNDNILKYTKPKANTVSVSANVRMRKTVPLNVDVKNAPQNLPELVIYEVTGSDTSTERQVSQIGIKGAPDVISQIENITLDDPIDFSTINYDDATTFNFKLTLPKISGVTYYDYTKVSNVYFEVNIDRSSFTFKSFDIPADNISVTSVPEGKTISVKTALKGVTVIGPYSEVKNLTVSNIHISINASELIQTGSSSVNPTLSVSSGGCWISGKYEVIADVS